MGETKSGKSGKRTIVDAGFGGDVSTERKTSVKMSGLKLLKVPCVPMFAGYKEKPVCSYDKINEQEKCMCDRHKACGDAVLPYGPKDAKYVFVGRDPIEADVESKRPFCQESPVGALFSRYLEVLGLDRAQCYITNCLFCKAQSTGSPTPDELHACMHFHKGEFKELTGVKYVFPMGSNAFQMMTSIVSSVTPFIGSYFECEYLHFGKITVVPLHHPGYLLRKASDQDKFLEVLEKMAVK